MVKWTCVIQESKVCFIGIACHEKMGRAGEGSQHSSQVQRKIRRYCNRYFKETHECWNVTKWSIICIIYLKSDVRTLAFCELSAELYYSVEENTTIPPKWRTEVPDVPSRPPRAPSHDYFRKFPAKFNLIEGWVAKSVARQLATAVFWVWLQTSLKNHKWAT